MKKKPKNDLRTLIAQLYRQDETWGEYQARNPEGAARAMAEMKAIIEENKRLSEAPTPNRKGDDWEKEFDEKFPRLVISINSHKWDKAERLEGSGEIVKNFIRAHRSQLLSSIRGKIEGKRKQIPTEEEARTIVQKASIAVEAVKYHAHNAAIDDILSIPLLNERNELTEVDKISELDSAAISLFAVHKTGDPDKVVDEAFRRILKTFQDRICEKAKQEERERILAALPEPHTDMEHDIVAGRIEDWNTAIEEIRQIITNPHH